MRAFQAADAADFFGREKLTNRLLDRLKTDSFLALIGPSGSGKSSVLKAGVLPALREGALPGSNEWFIAEMTPGSGKSSVLKAGVLPTLREGALPGSNEWFIAEMTPGSRPLEELGTALLRVAVNPPESFIGQLQDDSRGLLRAIRRALPDNNSHLLLVIDQFEELFALVNEEETGHFLNSLLTDVTDEKSPLTLAVTLRADYYDRPLHYARFDELMRVHSEVVLPLSPEELERATVGPAERVGLTVEPGLVTEIVADVLDQPGTLPLLQYALTELFNQQNEQQLILETYYAIGRVTGALARRAEELLAALDDACQEAVRQIFLRLVVLDDDGEYSRQQIPRSELTTLGDSLPEIGAGNIDTIIDAYGSARLITFDRAAATRTPTVEVAHDAMLREWERLYEWLETNRSNLIFHQQLNRAAAEWLSEE